MRRVPLLIVAMLSMAYGVWLGLVRLGWALPLGWPDQLIAHGPLMVGGFLGTLICLERALALGSAAGYAAPVFAASGAIAVVLVGTTPGALLITLASGLLVVMYALVLRRQPSLFLTMMAFGAAAWTVGNALWVNGAALHRVVLWWIAFLVLTIAGERLELNRVLRPTRMVLGQFAVAAALLLVGVIASATRPEMGVRLSGAGLIAVTAWLVRYDIARRTVRQRGVTRYMAIGLLAGYAWLAFAGIVAAASGTAAPGLVYDALLHAVFLGFAMSMVFAHAPVILPAILGRPLAFAPRFYVHLVVLHVSVVVRVVGDLVEDLARLRAHGGLLNTAALVVFVVNMVIAIASGRPTAKR